MTPFHRPRLPRLVRRGEEDRRTPEEPPAGAAPEASSPAASPEEPGEAAAAGREAAPPATRRAAPPEPGPEAAGSRPAPVRINAVGKVAPLGPGDRPTPPSAPEVPEDSADVLDFPGRRADAGRRRPLRWILGVLVALAALAAFALVVFYSPLLAVRDITIEGTDRVPEAEVRQALEPLQGVPLTRIDDERVRELVGEDIMVRDVRAEAHPPHELVVNVTERVPVATVKEGDQFVLVDNDGVAVGAVGSAEEAEVPQIDGGLAAVQGDSFGELVRVLQALPQPLLEQMQKAEAESDSDLRLQMRDGSTVVWGTSEDSEFKAEVLTSLTEALGDRGAGLTYDVSSPEYPVTRGS
ncbi:cell division protein FtsQ/DivIB [Rothia halotolerans]|uniref:cell division protein FtsQ/DivIB n=1 Tax=Rothia halotolerans TaxID=405770 RepID=UPI00101B7CA9|nr:FtsQ-type POTRA domain-containing protein [Rothia halotolerans]